jgi:hypothetical protein
VCSLHSLRSPDPFGHRSESLDSFEHPPNDLAAVYLQTSVVSKHTQVQVCRELGGTKIIGADGDNRFHWDRHLMQLVVVPDDACEA